MSPSSDANLILTFGEISTQFNRSFGIFILIFGSIGNILHCLILSQRTLRSNPCAFLFRMSSIANIISILIGVPTRILAGWNIDPTNTLSWLCKCRAFLVFTSRTIAFWLIVLATIDQWLSSSMKVHHRQMSTLKNARKGILIVIFLSISLHIQMFYCYEANLTNTPLKCYGKSLECRLITDLTYSFLTIILPLLLTLIFGLKTVSNVHQVCSRIHPMNTIAIIYSANPGIKKITSNRQRKKKLDHHLLLVLFIGVIISTLFTLPQAIDKLYSTFTIKFENSKNDDATDSLIYNIVLLLSFVASGTPFYIYILVGGTVYRNALSNLFKKSCRKLPQFFHK
jgi:hypothetical protein